MTPAAREEAALRKWAIMMGCRLPKLQAVSDKGFPDRSLLMPNGKIVPIEFKIGSDQLSPHQEAWIDWLERNDFNPLVVGSAQEAIDKLTGAY